MQHKIMQALEELELIGEDCLITSGFRTVKEQEALWMQGRYTPGKIVTSARGGWSYHNYGLAVDIVPVGPLGVELSARTYLEWSATARYETYGRIFQGIGFEWGYQLWKQDRPHFQYTQGLTIVQVSDSWLPDKERAKKERRDSLIVHLEKAREALKNPNMTEKRKIHLYDYIAKMNNRLALLA